MLVLLGLIITGAILVKRRRPILVTDGKLDRKSTLILVGIMIVLTILGSLNALPSQLFSYDTAEPWGRFVGMSLLGLVAAIPLALIALGFWLALDAMRRRAGIPMLAAEPSRSTSNDMLIAGLGIAGIIYAITPLNALGLRSGMPRTPTTVLNEVVPSLAGVPDVPMNAIITVVVVGIPLLVLAGLNSRWTLRAAGAITFLALIGVVGWSLDPVVNPLGAVLLIASLALVAVAVVVWGSVSAWSWIVAALAYQGLNGLRGTAYGAVWPDRLAAALTVMAAGALIALIAQRAARQRLPWRDDVKDP